MIKQPNTSNIDNYLAGLVNSETPLVLATVIQAVSPTSGNPGDKALVSADEIIDGWIGGGCAQPAVIEAAGKSLASGKPMVIRIGPEGEWQTLNGVVDFTSSCLSGGTLVIFIEPLYQQPTLCILGHSPVAISLCSQAATLDFSVSIASPEFGRDARLNSNLEHLPDGISHRADFSDIDCDFIVIATQGKHDRSAINAALESRAGYIGMVASRKKMAGLKTILLETGIEAELLGRIQGPAGIEIGAETPAEIALSILADLVRIRRSGKVKKYQANIPSQKELNQKQGSQKKALSPVKSGEGGCCGS
jgi:xanthine dehydrogenase accessory factor